MGSDPCHAPDAGSDLEPAFEAIRAVVDEVFPIELPDVLGARDALLGGFGLSARDCIHVAVMLRHGVKRIMSFDADVDRYPGITRIA